MLLGSIVFDTYSNMLTPNIQNLKNTDFSDILHDQSDYLSDKIKKTKDYFNKKSKEERDKLGVDVNKHEFVRT